MVMMNGKSSQQNSPSFSHQITMQVRNGSASWPNVGCQTQVLTSWWLPLPALPKTCSQRNCDDFDQLHVVVPRFASFDFPLFSSSPSPFSRLSDVRRRYYNPK